MTEDTSRMTFPQQIAASIEKKIQKGDYRVGDKLPTEPQLSERFGVSRGTIREALRILTSVGLLESRQGSGTYVKAKERLQIAIFRALSNTDEKNIMDVKNMLERHVASSAARNRKKDDLRRMRARLDQRNRTLRETERRKEDESFHLSVAEATHNDFLLSLYRYISDYTSTTTPHMGENTIGEKEMNDLHEMLYDAIEHQDDDMAEKVITRILEA